MATRLPLELLHEIILLNDDHINYLTGTIENGVTYSPIPRPGLDPIEIIYSGRRPKNCARTIGLVSTTWHSFVQHSPRLWLCSIRISLALYLERHVYPENIVISDDYSSRNNDIDVSLYHQNQEQRSESESMMEKILDLLLPTAPQWRSLHLESSPPVLWLKIQERIRHLPRMIYLHEQESYLYDIGDNPAQAMVLPKSDLSIPRLRFASLRMATIDARSHLGFLSATEGLQLRSLSGGANTEELIAQINLQFPFLVSLRLGVEPGPASNTEVRHSKRASGSPLLSLDLSAPWPDILTVMLGLSLQRLKRLNIFKLDDEPLLPSIEQIPTQSLTILDVSLVTGNDLQKLLGLLDRSSLEKLDIKLYDDVATPMGGDTVSVAELRLFFPKLRTLALPVTLECQGFHRSWAALEAPSLEDLFLWNVYPMRDSEIGMSTSQPLGTMACFPHLKKVTLRYRKILASHQVMLLDILKDLHLPSFQVLDIERSRADLCDVSQWAKAMEQMEHMLPSINELAVALPLETRSVTELFRKLQTLDTLRILLKCNPAINAILALSGDAEHAAPLPRLSVLTVAIQVDEQFEIDPVPIAEAIYQTLRRRQSFSPRISTLCLVDFDLDEEQRRDLGRTLEQQCDWVVWEFTPL